MAMDNPESIMSTSAWRDATAGVAVPARSWLSPLSRHLKLESLVDRSEGGGEAQEQQQQQGALHPLHVASSCGLGKAIKALVVTEGVDPSLPDCSGKTPLHWAAMMDRAAVVELLLEHGSRVDAVDASERSPLFSCCAFGASNSARLLLRNGADPNKACQRGQTPMHAAAAGGHIEVVEMLILAGGDALRRTACGANPRHVAQRQGHAAVVKLLEAGAGRQDILTSHGRNISSSYDEAQKSKQGFMAQHKLEWHGLLRRRPSERQRG